MTTSFFFTVTGTFDVTVVPADVHPTKEQEGQRQIVAVLNEGTVHVPHDPGSDGRHEAELAVYRYHMPANAPRMENTKVYLRPFCS